MKLRGAPERITLTAGELSAEFLPSGDLYEIKKGYLMLTGLRANPFDGAAGGLWLKKDGQCARLTGVRSGCNVEKGENALRMTGEALSVRYEITFILTEEGWYWKIALAGGGKASLLYGQDIGLAPEGSVLTNELYAAQYVDHSVLETPFGPAVRSRQNMGDEHPILLQGALGAQIEGWSTDGMQFFGLQYKGTNCPKAFSTKLENRVLQGEFSYTALETGALDLSASPRVCFYAALGDTPPSAAPEAESAFSPLPKVALSEDMGAPYASDEMEESEIVRRYPDRRLEERDHAGRLLSFFLPDSTHVVLRRKELICERPHGGIIQTRPDLNRVDNNLLAVTHYMYGVFGSQTVVGNTSMHEMDCVARGLFNVQKNGGRRIYVKLGGVYRLLTLPALYETGFNHAKWVYLTEKGDITVTLCAAVADTRAQLTVEGFSGMETLICDQLAGGEREFEGEVEIRVLREGRLLRLPMGTKYYPGVHFDMTLTEGLSLTDDGVFYADGKKRNETLLTMRARGDFSLVFGGALEGRAPRPLKPVDLSIERAKAAKSMDELTLGALIDTNDDAGEVLTHTLRWHAQCALTHYSMPHGLEQTGGAAWGARDVCQGPFELFLAYGKFELCRDILIHVFSHQEDAEWPQWFMFDEYPYKADDCHGDVIFWPLKILCDYVEATGDHSVQDEIVPYAGDRFPESLSMHVIRALEAIKERMIGKTGLVTYAGGDWDDTLQPAREELKERLVSTWTVELCYQVLTALRRLGYDTDDITKAIGRDFEKLLVKGNRVAGFAEIEKDGSIKLLLHPCDHETGITCRLLPLTRAILSGLSTEAITKESLNAIDTYLSCPDGVRLMDAPARYEGGISRRFVRAEQAANVGREISLQYVHAHIRYAEAMAKLKKGDRAFDALLRVAPPLLQNRVKNAMPRQSNLYFSSSEGDFADRYQYAREFSRLRDGSIPVKGGWRLYSSGPGIWTGTLIKNVLGINLFSDRAEISPALPASCDGMKVKIRLFNRMRDLTFRLTDEAEPLIILKSDGGRAFTVHYTAKEEM